VTRQALEKRRLLAENRELKARLDGTHGGLGELVGRSAPMERVFETVRQAANARSTVLVVGESGTGKELVARALHRLSPRAAGPFVTVNSGSLPPDLLESNLFGHVRGSFTGPCRTRKGSSRSPTRHDLLRRDRHDSARDAVEAPARPAGPGVPSRRSRRAHPRRHAGRRGDECRPEPARRRRTLSRGSLLPPLRDHDQPPAAARAEGGRAAPRRGARARAAAENGRSVPPVTPTAMKALLDYDWPGNVRELENVLERALILGPGVIDVEQLSDAVRRAVPRPSALPPKASRSRTPWTPTAAPSSSRRSSAPEGPEEGRGAPAPQADDAERDAQAERHADEGPFRPGRIERTRRLAVAPEEDERPVVAVRHALTNAASAARTSTSIWFTGLAREDDTTSRSRSVRTPRPPGSRPR